MQVRAGFRTGPDLFLGVGFWSIQRRPLHKSLKQRYSVWGEDMKGTIRERLNRDGSVSWLCQVEVGRDPVTGRRRYRSKVAASKREAHSVVHALIVEAGTQRCTGVVETAVTVGELIERWLEFAGPAAPSTRSVYAGYIKNQIVPYLGRVAISELRVTDLDRWYTELDRAGLAPASIRKAHNIVRGALTQAVRWGWLTANVAALARPPAVPRPVIATPRACDVRDLVKVVSEWDPQFAVFLRLAGVSGCRPGEMCALRWDDIDFLAGDLHVRRRIMREGGRMFPQDLTKTGKVRRIPLDRSTLARLREHRDTATALAAKLGVPLPGSGYVFSSSIDASVHWRPDAVSRKFTAYRKRAGWDAATLYSLRHQAATMHSGLTDELSRPRLSVHKVTDNEDPPPVAAGFVGLKPRSRRRRRFNDDGAHRQSRGDDVAQRERPFGARLVRPPLRHTRPRRGDAGGEGPVPGREHPVDTGAVHRDAAPTGVERTVVSGGIDAVSEAGHNAHPGACQAAGDFTGGAQPGGSGVTGPDHGHRTTITRSEGAAHEQQRGPVRNEAKVQRIPLGPGSDDRHRVGAQTLDQRDHAGHGVVAHAAQSLQHPGPIVVIELDLGNGAQVGLAGVKHRSEPMSRAARHRPAQRLHNTQDLRQRLRRHPPDVTGGRHDHRASPRKVMGWVRRKFVQKSMFGRRPSIAVGSPGDRQRGIHKTGACRNSHWSSHGASRSSHSYRSNGKKRPAQSAIKRGDRVHALYPGRREEADFDEAIATRHGPAHGRANHSGHARAVRPRPCSDPQELRTAGVRARAHPGAHRPPHT